MNDQIKQTADLTAVLSLIPYLDNDLIEALNKETGEITLAMVVDGLQKYGSTSNYSIALSKALEAHPEWEDIELVDVSSLDANSLSGGDATPDWKDDYIQACTFRDAEGNYYVSYRGTGDGRWFYVRIRSRKEGAYRECRHKKEQRGQEEDTFWKKLVENWRKGW